MSKLLVQCFAESWAIAPASACYEDIKHGRLPKPIKIGRNLYWSETNIDLLISKLQANSDGDQIDTPKPAVADNTRQSAKK